MTQRAGLIAIALLAATGAGPAIAQADHASTQGTTTLADKFAELDANGDGALSRSEAEADPTIASIYGSLNTGATLEEDAPQSDIKGLTLEQFEAGMQAAANGGSVGSAVSGGATYRVYPDGTIEAVEGSGAKARGEAQPEDQ